MIGDKRRTAFWHAQFASISPLLCKQTWKMDPEHIHIHTSAHIMQHLTACMSETNEYQTVIRSPNKRPVTLNNLTADGLDPSEHICISMLPVGDDTQGQTAS
jgi:hypothetical protein